MIIKSTLLIVASFIKIPIGSIKAGSGSSVGCASDWYSGGFEFDPPVWQLSFVEIRLEIISTAILSLPLIQVGQLSVTGERICIRGTSSCKNDIGIPVLT